MTEIYHITHIANLQNILSNGGLRCDRIARDNGLAKVSIAHQHIKDRRNLRGVPCSSGGTLADYVPFYFAPRSPMLFTINKGNVENYTSGQLPIIHLVSSVEATQGAGLSFAFTDGHADMTISKFFADVGDLDKIDWRIMGDRYWNDTNSDGDRKRRRQAEFLAHQFFPFELVAKIGTYNLKVANQVKSILADFAYKPVVKPERAWYYD